MKLNLPKIAFFILVSILLTEVGCNLAFGSESANEKVYLFTDRSLYITGESVCFSAFLESNNQTASGVLYIELITPDGVRISAQKLLLENRFASSSIALPPDMLSGVYYLKAYTKWMRNFSVADYTYIPLKIVNPSRTEILQSNRLSPDSLPFLSQALSKPNILIQTNAENYTKREHGTIGLQLPTNNEQIKMWTLSVVPSACGNLSSNYATPDSRNGNSKQMLLSEIKGLTLSGRVTQTESDNPAPFVQVNLSILGNNPDFIATRTDSTGEFIFSLPKLYEKTDLYVGIEEKGSNTIKIDNDYCTRETFLPSVPFTLSNQEFDAVKSMVQNLEIERSFFKDKTLKLPTVELPVGKPFYGTPDNTFLFDKYVDLLSVNEYFHELISNVAVRTRSGKSYFKIFSNQPEMQVYEPLVLIDLIAIDRVDRILAANPNLLSRIEIVTKPYYKGDMIFGGIISFFSRKGDLAGIDLPSSDTFLELDFFSNYSCRDILEMPIPSNHPDTRNTILWVTQFSSQLARNLTFDFQTPDTPGKYSILFNGITKNGELVHAESSFTVK